MVNLKITILLISIIAILLTTVTPIFALDYNPGVLPGQYIKYGNFIGEGPGFELFNDYDWQKIQIVETSNKEITLLFTGQFKMVLQPLAIIQQLFGIQKQELKTKSQVLKAQ